MRRRWVAVVLTVIAGAAIAAPLLDAWGAGIYAALGWVCHQRPERSWHLAGKPLGVCVRCVGLYVGALLGALLGGKFWRRPALAMLAVMATDWLLETIGCVGPRPWWRFGIGLAVGALVAPALWSEQREQPMRRIG